MHEKEELLNHLSLIHTTEMGRDRIIRNLSLDTEDAVEWCKNKIKAPHAEIMRKGKNWYITVDNCLLTVNAYSYTIITAHPIKSPKK